MNIKIFNTIKSIYTNSTTFVKNAVSFIKKFTSIFSKTVAFILNALLSLFFPKEVERYIKIILYIAIPVAMYFGFQQFFTAPTFIEALFGLILTMIPKFLIKNIDLR